MIIKRNKILQIYDEFKFLFQSSYGNAIYFKSINTQLFYNINDWKLFFKIINLIGILHLLAIIYIHFHFWKL